MKGNEITNEDVKKWKDGGRFAVACRICGEVVLFPYGMYDPKDKQLQGYECADCRRLLDFYGRI